MKYAVLAFALVSTPVFAARDIISLDCKSRPRAFADLQLEVKSYWSSADQKESTMRDVTLTMIDGGKKSVGRAHTIDNDTKYKPRKYLDHLRFDMNQLTDTSDFSKFYPDSCTISVLVAKDLVVSHVSFAELPVILNCDQSGGTLTLDCKVGTVR